MVAWSVHDFHLDLNITTNIAALACSVGWLLGPQKLPHPCVNAWTCGQMCINSHKYCEFATFMFPIGLKLLVRIHRPEEPLIFKLLIKPFDFYFKTSEFGPAHRRQLWCWESQNDLEHKMERFGFLKPPPFLELCRFTLTTSLCLLCSISTNPMACVCICTCVYLLAVTAPLGKALMCSKKWIHYRPRVDPHICSASIM